MNTCMTSKIAKFSGLTFSDRGPEGGEGREIEQWRQFEGGGGSRGPWLHAAIGRAANNSVT